MEPTVIAAIIAGGVSIGGVVTSIAFQYMLNKKNNEIAKKEHAIEIQTQYAKMGAEIKAEKERLLIEITASRENQVREFEQQITALKLEHKTIVMAEETARHYLEKDTNPRRSFEHLRNRLGGFSDNEVRQILVRAGAVRYFFDNDDTEWWYLLSRKAEVYELNDRLKGKTQKSESSDPNDQAGPPTNA